MIHNVVTDSVIFVQKVCEVNCPTKIKEKLLLRWGLCCTYLRYGVKSVRQKTLTLYELNRVPEILKLFKCPSPELEQGVSQLIENFDPEDPYWRVSILPLEQYHIVSTVITLWNNTTDINNLHRPSWPCRLPVVSLCCIHWQGEDFEVSSNEIEQLSVEEIQETLQIQQFKRSVLLSQVKDSPTAVVTEIRLQDHEAVLDLSQNINTVLLLCGWIHKTNALKCVSIVWWWKFLIPNIIL